jgi:hypothetical protein
MQRKTIVLATLAALATSTGATAQDGDPDAEMKKHRDRAQAREEQRLAEELAKLPPEERAKALRFDAANKAAVRKINGRETPELVPYHVRMQMFFHNFEAHFKRSLEPELSEADLAILSKFAQRQHAIELKKSNEALHEESRSISARARHMSAIEIASGMKSASDRALARQAAIYRAVIEQLSPESRKLVNDFAFTRIRPQVSIQDPMDLASLEPEIYREQIIRAFEAESAEPIASPEATPPPKEVLLNSGSNTRVKKQ